jgi:4-coumarate--CoA ligase
MFPNMEGKYMSPEEQELGPGEPGELWLRGPNVFKGYWKNEEATKNSITPDGFFKTGDVGYTDKDGNFYITDRVKELIKYKGFQVAPAELEGKLMDHPNVNDVAVIGVHDEDQHTEVPRAYVVPAEGKEEHHASQIVEWMTEKVAHHKRLRGGVVFIEEVPKSASGKILRRVLKEKAKEDGKKNGKPKAKL